MAKQVPSKPFRLSGKARQDLLEIGRHTTRKWGRAQRNHYLQQLDEAFMLLAKNPAIGTGCEDVLQGYRKFQQGSHVIYYRITECIEIIRVLHGQMDPEHRVS